VQPGNYLLHLQVAPIENDAAPSRPLLYKFSKVQ
jgi:arylformamidase